MAKTKVERWDLDRTMQELKRLGSPQQVKTYRRHGATGDLYGVKIGDLKKILKHVKDDQDLALRLWDTDNSDAMYLAAMIADGSQMRRRDLDRWVRSARWYMLSEYSVPSVASEHPDAFAIAKKWMGRKDEGIAAAGWCTYAATLSIRDDEELPMDEIKSLLDHVAETIHDRANRVRHCMNQFVINVGTYVKPLLKQAKSTAKAIGTVDVDMGDTSCKVPSATDYIAKVEKMGRVGKKRSSAKC